MARSETDFRTLFPEFTTTVAPSASVTAWLGRAENRLNPDAFGNLYDDAVLYWTAHNLSLSIQADSTGLDAGASVGVVTAARVGQVSKSIAIPQAVQSGQTWENELGQTRYGVRFLALLDEVIPAGKITDDSPFITSRFV